MQVFCRLLIPMLVALISVPASAGLRLHGSGVTSTTSQSSIVGFDSFDFPYANFVKQADLSFTTAPTTTALGNFLTADQYPTGTLPGSLSYFIALPSNYFGKYVMTFTGVVSGGSGVQFGNAFTGTIYSTTGVSSASCTAPCQPLNNYNVTSATNYTVTFDLSEAVTGAVNNGSGLIRLSVPSGFAGQGNFQVGSNITVSGVIGSDGNGCGANGQWIVAAQTTTTIDLANSSFPGACTYTSGGQAFPYQQGLTRLQLNMIFSSGATFTGVTNIAICKLADYNADNTCSTTAGKTAWTGGFNDDFVQKLAQLKPRYIRYLDANNQVFTNPSDWATRQKTSFMTYQGGSLTGFAPSRWFGSDTTHTNSYAASCTGACTYTLTGGAPANGDAVQLYTSNANTSATPTLQLTDSNSVTSAAIPVISSLGHMSQGLIGGAFTPGDVVTLTFTSTCITGSTHISYTVQGGDTGNSVVIGLQAPGNPSSLPNNTTLSSQPIVMVLYNSFGGGNFNLAWGIQACQMTITPSVSGAATETVTIGTASAGEISTNSLNTFVYNSLLGMWVHYVGGFSSGWPYELQIDLANAVSTAANANVGCWVQFNLLFSDASVTSLANLEASNPCTGGDWNELANEIWLNQNAETDQADQLASGLALGQFQRVTYNMLRSVQTIKIFQTAFAATGQTGKLHPIAAFQEASASASLLNGVGLCGTSCGNTAYQNYVGNDYNTSPTQPHNFLSAISQAPYYYGAIIEQGTPGAGQYGSPSDYGSWSSTAASVASNVLTIGGTITGTAYPNQGISACHGVYIKNPTPSNWASGQLTGTVTTTLSATPSTTTWSVTSTAGLQTGMWAYDATTGNINGTIASIGSGTVTLSGGAIYVGFGAALSGDTMIFGGKAGTYQLNSTTCAAAPASMTGGDVLGLQAAADNYSQVNSALGTQQDGLNWVYQDTLVSVRNGSMETSRTVQSLNFNYNIMKNVGGYGLPLNDYEGGESDVAPSTSQATTMGLSSAYGGFGIYSSGNGTTAVGGYVDALIIGFRNSSLLNSLETTRHVNELAIVPAGSITMKFNFETAGTWASFPTSLYDTPWQDLKAMCAYNGGSC